MMRGGVLSIRFVMAKTKCIFRFINSVDQGKLKQSRCLFTISVGQQTHEGSHFRATIDLLRESFGSCVMLVDDSLQRHTMAIGTNYLPEHFYETAIKEGDLWLERNKKYYSQLENLDEIIRWDTWLKHRKFNEQKNAIQKLINEDVEYALAFKRSVNEYVDKCNFRAQGSEKLDLERAKRLSFDFILEECTALCLWTELNCSYEVYPNLHNAAINETRKRFVHNIMPGSLQAVTLGFRHAEQLAPQRFFLFEQAMSQMLSGVTG